MNPEQNTTSQENAMTEIPVDTDRLKSAIEKVTDHETSGIPPLPLTGIKPEKNKGAQKSECTPLDAPVHTWFITFMCMNIPVIGWIYLLYLAFRKDTTLRRNFARAYLFYKLVFLLISLVILGILVYIGMGLLENLLAYMEML